MRRFGKLPDRALPALILAGAADRNFPDPGVENGDIAMFSAIAASL